jgi:hypothetical protein
VLPGCDIHRAMMVVALRLSRFGLPLTTVQSMILG